MKKKLVPLFLPVIFCFNVTKAQDSLLRLIALANQDTIKAMLYVDAGMEVENSAPEIAKIYYKNARQLAARHQYAPAIYKAIAGYTYVLNMQGKYDSSAVMNQEAVELARSRKDSLPLAKALFNTGTSYRERGEYETAVKYYEEGKIIFQLIGQERLSAVGEDVQQVLYNDMHQYERGIQHGERAVQLSRDAGDNRQLCIALSNLGLNYADVRKLDKAQRVYEEALALSQRNGDTYMEMVATLNLADILIQQDKYDKTEPYFQKVLKMAEELDAKDSRALALKGLSYHYGHARQYEKAKAYARQALDIAGEQQLRKLKGSILKQMGNLAYATQNPVLGNQYNTAATLLEDSLFNEAMAKRTQELEVKYATELKESKILQLESDSDLQALSIKNKNMLITFLSLLAAAFVLVGLLLYRAYRHRQKVQQLRIHELETEKQLAATEAVLKGEEQERARMAKDLHDGLGGMLSGVKFSLNNFRGNLVMTPDSAMAFERSLDMLDSSIGEMRRIAHNLLPEALIQYGLNTALLGLCRDVSNSGALQVRYQPINVENLPLDQSKAITIYRMVQELLNNTLKHARAQHALVQLSRTDNTLSITVEDDGQGFDAGILESTSGMGWANIRNRVNFLNGRLDVDSGAGTSVFIEIPL